MKLQNPGLNVRIANRIPLEFLIRTVMKKLLMIIMLLLTIACQPKKTSKEETIAHLPLYTKEDTVLLDQARLFFKALPSEAVSAENEATAAKVKLGKILFFDKRLSKSGNSSCNSCHNLASYGVDNTATSQGDDGKFGERNSPSVFNAALHNMQFWDGRAKTVEEQAGMPILNPGEMAIPHKGFLVDRLKNEKQYNDLFKVAYPEQKNPINYTNVQKAIGAFERTLLTPSRFDQFMNGKLDAIDSTEKAGMKFFLNNGCANCHNGVGMGGETMVKFGLYTDYRTLTKSRVDDQGRMSVTGKKSDKDVFKVPGLRNVEKTYPYFHDGSIASLDSTIRIMAQVQLNKKFTNVEIKAIISFLKTLTGEIREEAKKEPEELATMARK
jgi:cytochrome c peroxidase